MLNCDEYVQGLFSKKRESTEQLKRKVAMKNKDDYGDDGGVNNTCAPCIASDLYFYLFVF